MDNLMKKLSILLLSIFLVKVQANSEVENEITNTRIFPGTKVSFKAFALVDFLSNYICTYSIQFAYRMPSARFKILLKYSVIK